MGADSFSLFCCLAGNTHLCVSCYNLHTKPSPFTLASTYFAVSWNGHIQDAEVEVYQLALLINK